MLPIISRQSIVYGDSFHQYSPSTAQENDRKRKTGRVSVSLFLFKSRGSLIQRATQTRPFRALPAEQSQMQNKFIIPLFQSVRGPTLCFCSTVQSSRSYSRSPIRNSTTLEKCITPRTPTFRTSFYIETIKSFFTLHVTSVTELAFQNACLASFSVICMPG